MRRLATLIKRMTDDGLVEIQDDVELGKTYTVDDRTIRMATGYNHVLKKKWMRLIIDVKSDEGVRWFPLELLQMKRLINVPRPINSGRESNGRRQGTAGI